MLFVIFMFVASVIITRLAGSYRLDAITPLVELGLAILEGVQSSPFTSLCLHHHTKKDTSPTMSSITRVALLPALRSTMATQLARASPTAFIGRRFVHAEVHNPVRFIDQYSTGRISDIHP